MPLHGVTEFQSQEIIKVICKNTSANGPPIKKVVHSVAETGPLVAKHRMKGKGSHLVRRMMCTPESVTTAWLSSPTCQYA